MLLGCFLRFTVVPQVASGAKPVAGKALVSSRLAEEYFEEKSICNARKK